ncbi:hypothetical protein SDC9_211267 [bioreactor metagenome]|uniref:Uncharacterized protein n=1 Tax=bioreactor metagenome TaxID=1076179 RepID=A0A645JWD5_9ZZZZ
MDHRHHIASGSLRRTAGKNVVHATHQDDAGGVFGTYVPGKACQHPTGGVTVDAPVDSGDADCFRHQRDPAIASAYPISENEAVSQKNCFHRVSSLA